METNSYDDNEIAAALASQPHQEDADMTDDMDECYAADQTNQGGETTVIDNIAPEQLITNAPAEIFAAAN